jgi:hypothetical protein
MSTFIVTKVKNIQVRKHLPKFGINVFVHVRESASFPIYDGLNVILCKGDGIACPGLSRGKDEATGEKGKR